MGKDIALVGDTSTHGGAITVSGQDGTFDVGGIAVAVSGAKLACPMHGVQTITAVTTKSFQNGKLIVTAGATAGCGATITPPSRGVQVE
jgi:uncharacterized Zn-binding protein involved in type VI secretion